MESKQLNSFWIWRNCCTSRRRKSNVPKNQNFTCREIWLQNIITTCWSPTLATTTSCALTRKPCAFICDFLKFWIRMEENKWKIILSRSNFFVNLNQFNKICLGPARPADRWSKGAGRATAIFHTLGPTSPTRRQLFWNQN